MLQNVLALGLLGTSACQAAAPPAPETVLATTTPDVKVTAPAPIRSSGTGALERIPEVAERTVKSVVNIAVEKTVRVRGGASPFEADPFFRQFFGQRGNQGVPQERREQSGGSGVIVSPDGIILTNNHVVGGADEIRVTLSDGREYTAEVVGTDAPSDLAVVRLEDPPAGLTALPYGDSGDLRLGELVLAIGNPFGIGQTVTMGIVSATGRANMGIVDYEDFIQTDAAINPGNSGGALVDMDGNLVGINTAIISGSGGYQGIGFAIPSEMAKRIADDLMDDGQVSRGFLGVSIQDLDDDLRTALDLADVDDGVLISGVQPEGAADKAGFERGDVVLEFDGKPVANASAFRLAVANAGADQSFRALVLRAGDRKKLKGTLGTLGGDEARSPAAPAPTNALDDLGMQLTELDAELRERLAVPRQVRGGAVIQDVAAGSIAQRAGLRAGDVILEVNEQAVRATSDVPKALSRSRDRALLLVLRGRGTMYVVVPVR